MLILVNAERVGVVPAKVVQLLDDGTVVVDWYNGPAGKFSATSAVYPVYYDRAAKGKEVYTWKPTKQQEMDACWTIIRAKQIVGPGFDLECKAGKFYLPKAAQLQLKAFQKGMTKSTAKKNTKK